MQIDILNKELNPVSGEQRAEYNFHRKIEDSLKQDLLLIDEPESSFDNMFLNNRINTVLQDISKRIPVFVSTHNNRIGASNDSSVSNLSVQLNCLEAGERTSKTRRDTY